MKKTKIVTKKVIANKIQKKLNYTLKKTVIQDAISVMCVMIQKELIRDQAVSIENFGTLSPYTFHQHMGRNVVTKQLQEIESFRSVKFRPHSVFLELLAQRKASFLTNETKSKPGFKKS